MRHSLAVLVLAVIVAACGSAAPSSPPATASASQGDFRLDLYVDRTIWRPGDLVTGTSFLVNMSGGPVTAYGSGMGLVSYVYREVGGSRVLGNVMTADCSGQNVPFGGLTYRLWANGGVSSDPAEAWIASANDANGVRLPAGTWDIAAQADFYTGGDMCFGTEVKLNATARVTVLP